MRDQIATLEQEARQLHTTSEQREKWINDVAGYADGFLDALPHGKAYEKRDTSQMLEDVPVTDTPRRMQDILSLLEESVDTPGINPASGGHIGYIPGGGVYAAALGDFMADITNRYAGVYFASPGAVRMENLMIRWMCDIVGYPDTAHGNLTSGGSIANLIGITTARDALDITSAVVPNAVIYVNSQTHHCVHKAIRIAGLAEADLREVPLDDRFRMDADKLEQMIVADQAAGKRPFMVVASLGCTDTGAIDPIEEIAAIAARYALWFQVDAAYGGFFALVPELAPRLRGVEHSDSYIVDPHKGLFLPYGTGAILVKDAELLARSHYYRANYMQDAVNASGQYSPADLSPELTKHFRGLRMWLPLQLHGLAPFKAALKEKWLLALYFYEQIKSAGFEVGPEPELSVAIYRYDEEGLDANAFNDALIKAVQQDGRIFISSTLIDGVFWLRLAILCFRTHLVHVDLLLELLIHHRDKLLAGGAFRT